LKNNKILKVVVSICVVLAVVLVLVLTLGLGRQPAKEEEMTEYQSIFKNEQAEAAYMAAYDSVLENWPVPYETRTVTTSYGETHMIVSGPVDGEPIIVLHGGDSDATIMSPLFPALAQSYRVYSLDVIGYAGKSKAAKVIEDRAGVAEWLTGVLDALDIEKAHMVGWSMGGFLTTNYALEAPERLNKIVLLAPAATFVPYSASEDWLFKVVLPSIVTGIARQEYDARLGASYAIGGVFGAYNISMEDLEEGIEDEDLAELMLDLREESLTEFEERIDSVAKSIWQYLYLPENLDEVSDQLVQYYLLRGKTYKFLLPYNLMPAALPEDDLENLKTPTLLLIGDQEVVYAANQTIARAEELLENIQTALLPNCRHMVVYEKTELVNSLILDFLSGD
jgi:pimeloyl-ACP methyl ester carboxylesterase